MKKLLTFLLLANISIQCIGQTTVNFGAEAGVTSTRLRSIDFGGDENNTFTNGGGFYIGGLVHINKEKPFSIQSGVRFASTKAMEKTTYNSFPGITVNGEVKMSFVEVPVLFTFQKGSGKSCRKWFGYFGPEFNIAVSGNKFATITGFPNVDEKIKFGKADDEFKRLQINFGAGLGYKISKHINATAAYKFGVNDIDNNNDYETRFNNLRIGLQYIF